MDTTSERIWWFLDHNSPKTMARINAFLDKQKATKVRRQFRCVVVTDESGITHNFLLDPFEFIVLR